jgi:acetylglutamate kinase
MVLDWPEKAALLVEALPYIKKVYGKKIVIKYGGNAMLNEDLKNSIIQDIVLLKYLGVKPVIVHGGGPAINSMLDRVGIKSSFVNGLRVTDEATMEIAQMVLVGKINKEIVTLLNKHGARAVGLCGKDADFIKVDKQLVEIKDDTGTVTKDIGLVGRVREIDTEILDVLTDKGFIPVIAPVGVGSEGKSYNINADYAGGAVAWALKADKFILLTDVEGVIDKRKGERQLISRINEREAKQLIEEGVITGGMIPKITCCLEALEKGVEKIHIINGTVMHSLLLEVLTDRGTGTMIEK